MTARISLIKHIDNKGTVAARHRQHRIVLKLPSAGRGTYDLLIKHRIEDTALGIINEPYVIVHIDVGDGVGVTESS